VIVDEFKILNSEKNMSGESSYDQMQKGDRNMKVENLAVVEKGLSSSNKEMYRLSGDPELVSSSLERYKKSNEQVDAQLTTKIAQGLDDKNSDVRLAAARLIDQVQPIGDRTRLIFQGLDSHDGNLRSFVIGLIDQAASEDQEALRKKVASIIEQGLGDENENVRSNVFKFISQVSVLDRARFIQQGIQDKSVYVRLTTANFIDQVLPEDRVHFIEQLLNDEDESVRLAVVKLIDLVPAKIQEKLRKKTSEIIKQRLENRVLRVSATAVKLIDYASFADHEQLKRRAFDTVEEMLKSNDWDMRLSAIKFIDHVPTENQEQLRVEAAKVIKNFFEGDNWHARWMAMELIDRVSLDAQEPLKKKAAEIIEQGIDNLSWSVRSTAIKLIDQVPIKNRARLIAKGLEDGEVYVRVLTAQFIDQAAPEEQVELIRKALEDSDYFVGLIAVELLAQLPDADQARLRQNNPRFLKDLTGFPGQTPLYNKQGDQVFFRKSFEKTGTGMTLLDRIPGGDSEKSLRDKVVIRHIPLNAYLAWREAYEAADFWRSQGFDYVPIEPIVKVSQGKELFLVDVFTRVLNGPSVGRWKEQINKYIKEIDEKVEKIRSGLKILGIKHGHDHPDNFIVFFDRDEQGNIVLDRPPKVYMIDFDEADFGTEE